MPIAEISSALSALSTVLKIAKSINDSVKKVEVNQKVMELQVQIIEVNSKILAAQQEYEKMAKANVDMETRLKEYDSWEKEQHKYTFKEIRKGLFLYESNQDS